jgi:hypothetical protein
MWFRLASALVAAAVLSAAPAYAAGPLQLADDAPETYTVQKGDTLWAISGHFLKDPWRWPDIWGMNRAQIKDPHWIYPGDVITLDRNAPGGPRLSVAHPTVRLSPGTRVQDLDAQAIPAIPAEDLEPYLTKALVTSTAGLSGSAEIVAGRDRERIVRGTGDRIYAVGMDPKGGDTWYIYRPGKALVGIDPPQDILGFENRFIGVVRVERFGEVSTLTITEANEEVFVGDRLMPLPRETLLNYVPHSPAKDISGRIIASYANASEMGRGSIVTIDKGARNGLDVGAVLAVYRGERPIKDPRPNTDAPQILRYLDQSTWYTPDHYLDVPEERVGLMFVFRTFDKVSYAVLLNTTDPVVVGDHYRQP